MRTPPGPGPLESRLFDEPTLIAASEAAADSHIHWLGVSDDPEAMNMRRVLEHCWALAGDSREVLRKGLLHERWGQHAGALAHLLSVGLFDREGWAVTCEPTYRNKSPDLLIERHGFRALVEVRSITGRGETPWDRNAPLPQSGTPTLPPPRPAGAGTGAGTVAGTGASAGTDPDPRQREAFKRQARARARKLAARRAAAEAARDDDLRDVVHRVLEKKAAAYRELCADEDLPYLICLYQDTDDQLSPIVCDWAFGQGGREQDAHGGWYSTHDPANGVFFGDRWHFGHVSGVVVFGRLDDERGRLFMRGDLIVNPYAERPLPANPSMPHLRSYLLRTNDTPTRMRWTPHVMPPYEIAPHP